MIRIVLIILLLGLGTTHSMAQNFMKDFALTRAPTGFVEYCKKHKGSCLIETKANSYPVSALNLSDLFEINRLVNTAIEPATDKETYGVDERWELPKTKGDCEDYAILKQRLLKAMGWPQSALLLTVVIDEKNQPHAVLTAQTSQGDYILDNKTNEVRLWSQFPYHFVMRQSSNDPTRWYSIEK